MIDLQQKFRETIQTGLRRRAITKCSTHSERSRIMGMPFPGPWTFKHHPWLREMQDTKHETNVGQKGAQLGYTELCLNTAFYYVDIKQMDVLYVLPAKTPDASDFSSSRFDGALDLSPYLQDLFSDVKNVGHKRAGSVDMYIRGSRSRAGLKSIPTGVVILDELDEMNQKNIPLALERQSGQLEKITWMISTPTVDGFGINEKYLLSTQDEFFFRCPHCNRLTELIFPECLVITAEDSTDPGVMNSYLKCKECDHKLQHETKHEWLESGIWVPKYPERQTRGFHIPQLYSSAVAGRPQELAMAWLRAQTNPADEQEFYNSKLGLPHIIADARITDIDLDNAKGNYTNGTPATENRIITLGIDVGKWLHYCVVEWTPNGKFSPDVNMGMKARILETKKVVNFEELDLLMRRYRPNFTVIDAHPEKRKAYEFATRFWGYVKLCYYGNSINGKQIHESETEMEATVTVDRTSWLDLSLGRFHCNQVSIPCDVDLEFQSHLKCPVHIYRKDSDGNPIGSYLSPQDDHYAHSFNYAEIALALATKIGTSTTIRSPR